MRLCDEHELREAVAHPRKMAEKVNKLFAKKSTSELISDKMVTFSFHPRAWEPEMNDVYKTLYLRWCAYGALQNLRDLIDSGKAPLFEVDDAGIVCFDVYLTGGNGPNRARKLTRVSVQEKGEGNFAIILDAFLWNEVW